MKDYKGGATTAAGEAFDSSLENLDARTRIVEMGGLKAGLLQKKNRGETVSLLLTLHYGNEESLKGQTTAAGHAGAADDGRHQEARPAGAARRARRAGHPHLGGRRRGRPGRGRRGGGGGGAGTPGQLTFSIEAKRSTLPTAIKLLGEILREPAFPEAEFDNMKRRTRAMSAMMRSEPSALAANRLARALSPYPPDDVRYVPTAEESAKRMEAVTLAQVIALYEKQLGAAQAELAIVGDFDPEPTLLQIRDHSQKLEIERTR